MLTVKSTFKLFDVVNKHFHDDHDTRLFISEVEEIMDTKVDLKMNDFATRKDLAEHRAATKQDYTELKTELKLEIGDLRTDFKMLDASINLNLANSAAIMERTLKDHLKWTMGIMVALLTLTVALIKLT